MPKPEHRELSANARILRANIRISRDPNKIRIGLTPEEFREASNELLKYLEASDSDDKDEKIILFLEIINPAL